MLLLADENFDNAIIRGLLRRRPELDILRVQDVGLSGVADPTILEWAANEQRLLLTHDVSTITHFAYQRIKEGFPMPGVIEVSAAVPIGQVIEDILLLVDYSLDNEWDGQIVYLPLR